jgi:phage-related protein
MNFIREIYYFKDYYLDFFNSLDEDVKLKFNWTLQLIATVEKVSKKYLKHLPDTSGLYEVRVEVGSNIYRVFSFFFFFQLVVLMNGFQKKTQKTPKSEIKIAERIKKEYFNEKSK